MPGAASYETPHRQIGEHDARALLAEVAAQLEEVARQLRRIIEMLGSVRR